MVRGHGAPSQSGHCRRGPLGARQLGQQLLQACGPGRQCLHHQAARALRQPDEGRRITGVEATKLRESNGEPQRESLHPSSSAERTITMLFTRLRDFDWTLLGFVLIMSVISVVEIRSATATTKFHGFQVKQVEFIAVGLVLMFIISAIDYHRLLDIAPWAYGISIVSLVAVLIPHIGQKVLGARRWINLGGGVHFQPSEGVKLGLIFVAQLFLWTRVGEEMSWRDIGKVVALVGLPMVLVLKQPDLGTALTYLPVLIVGMFLGGMQWKQAGIIILGLLVLGGIGLATGKPLKPYQQKRIDAFLNPDSDPKGSGYQISKSLIAGRSGGTWGRGSNKGS